MPSDGYNILENGFGDVQHWVASTDNLIQAQQKIGELKTSKPGTDYVIFDVKNSQFVI